MLAVSALNQSYGGSHTLWDVDLKVPAGSRTCLMGRNGMGKTTLLKAMIGALRPTAGRIVVDERADVLALLVRVCHWLRNCALFCPAAHLGNTC